MKQLHTHGLHFYYSKAQPAHDDRAAVLCGSDYRADGLVRHKDILQSRIRRLKYHLPISAAALSMPPSADDPYWLETKFRP